MKLAYKMIILALCMAGIIQAQDDVSVSSLNNPNKDLIPSTLQQIANNVGQKALLSTITNQANIEQVGNNNKAIITQNFGSNTNPNFASIVQSSNNNSAAITQTGNGNSSTISQYGNGNEAVENVDGNNNTARIIQNGNYNVSFENINVDNRNYVIMQQGNNNAIMKYDGTQSPKSLIISQQGNGMRLIINGSNFVK